jgi:protein TonB
LGEEDESVLNTERPFPGVTGTEGVLGGYLKSHLLYIKDIIQKNITYPDTARRNGWMGKVKVSFVIKNNGRAKDIKVIQSSGFRILDKSAKEAVSRSSPFPHPPAEARIIIPILYTLH